MAQGIVFFLECPAGKVLSREDHWLRFLLPAGVKFRVGCGSSRGVPPFPRRASPVGEPCGQAP